MYKRAAKELTWLPIPKAAVRQFRDTQRNTLNGWNKNSPLSSRKRFCIEADLLGAEGEGDKSLEEQAPTLRSVQRHQSHSCASNTLIGVTVRLHNSRFITRAAVPAPDMAVGYIKVKVTELQAWQGKWISSAFCWLSQIQATALASAEIALLKKPCNSFLFNAAFSQRVLRPISHKSWK